MTRLAADGYTASTMTDQTAIIRQTDYPLTLSADCAQFACQFDTAKETVIDAATLSLSLPEQLSTAVGKRKNEYLAGRYCSQQALKALNGPWQSTIETDSNRAPIWPDNYVGSITHSHGFAAAVVANRQQVLSIGIDSEKMVKEKTADNIQSQILTSDEKFERYQDSFTDLAEYLTLIFSAKESLFKCLYPLVNRYFSFSDARISLDPNQSGSFEYTLLHDLSAEFRQNYSGTGHYAKADKFYHTGIVLLAE